MKNQLREYTLPRSEEASRVGGWILGNTKIGPVLDVKVCLRQKRHGIEIMLESSIREQTVSDVRIVNGINTYLTETSQEISMYSETCGEGKVATKAYWDTVSHFYSCSWKRLERHHPERFRQDCFTVSTAIIRILLHDESVLREDHGAVRFWRPGRKVQGKIRWYVAMDSWCLDNFPGKRRSKEQVSMLREPWFFQTFPVISEQSRDIHVDLPLQDNVLLPDDFAEHIHHIENGFEMHSITKSGLIPGGRSLKKDRQSVFFNQDLEDFQYDLDKPRITVYKNNWRIHQHTVYWWNLKLAQEKGLQFYQTRSHTVVLYNTLLAIRIEKVLYMNTGEEPHCKVYQSPRLPRAVLTPNLHHGRQDPPSPDARKSTDHQREQSVYRETCRSLLENTRRKHPGESQRWRYRESCRGNVEYRISRFPHSTVQKEDTNRKETVKRLIQQFENHPKRDSLKQDFNKTKEFDPFSEKKELITDMGNTEIFELCDSSCKIQCPDGALLGSGQYLLHMRQMHAAHRKESTVEQGKIRRPANARLRHQKESCPRCRTWTISAADHVPQSTWYAEESPKAQKWWLQNHFGKMAR